MKRIDEFTTSGTVVALVAVALFAVLASVAVAEQITRSGPMVTVDWEEQRQAVESVADTAQQVIDQYGEDIEGFKNAMSRIAEELAIAVEAMVQKPGPDAEANVARALSQSLADARLACDDLIIQRDAVVEALQAAKDSGEQQVASIRETASRYRLYADRVDNELNVVEDHIDGVRDQIQNLNLTTDTVLPPRIDRDLRKLRARHDELAFSRKQNIATSTQLNEDANYVSSVVDNLDAAEATVWSVSDEVTVLARTFQEMGAAHGDRIDARSVSQTFGRLNASLSHFERAEGALENARPSVRAVQDAFSGWPGGALPSIQGRSASAQDSILGWLLNYERIEE